MAAMVQPMKTNNITMFACPDNFVGEILLLGRYGGAYTQHYRITSIDRNRCQAYLEAVTPRSVPNGDGTFSTRYDLGLNDQ